MPGSPDCEECQSFSMDQCQSHGPPSFILDSPTPLGVPQRALLTLPPGLVIGRSRIPGAGLGVYNQGQVVPIGVHFGPYEGEVTSREVAIETGYSWVICKNKDQFEYIDATRDTHSNWMRYVNCARNEEEQNLVAFQHKGQVFYRCLRPVLQGQELLVWHEDEYAKELGVTWDYLWDKKCTPADRSVEDSTKVIPCTHCQFSFTAELYFHKHVKRSHPKEYMKLLESGSVSVVTRLPPSDKDHQSLPFHEVTSEAQPASETGRPHNGTKNQKNFSQIEIPEFKLKQIHTASVQFSCPSCGKEFGDSESLKAHKCTQTYACMHCERSFARLCHLKRHEQTIHVKEKPYCCAKCGKCFTQSAGLKRHQHIHTGRSKHGIIKVSSQVFLCSQCSFSFTTELKFNEHMEQNHLEKHLKLLESESVKSGSDTQCQPSNSSGTPKTLKRMCLRRSRVPVNLKPQKMNSEGSCCCKLCGMSFSDSESLKAHECISAGEGSFCSAECVSDFSDSKSLKTHKCVQTGEGNNRCIECDQSFSDEDGLKSHQCIAPGEGSYGCTQCGKSFTRPCNLRRHERTIHIKEKPYYCSQCGKYFSQSAGLKRHQQIHIGVTPHRQNVEVSSQVFPCSQCTFSFTAEHYLHKHIKRYHPEEHHKMLESGSVLKTQTDEESLSCTQCGKTFSCSKTLKAHQCFQTGKRLFLCSECGKCFTWFYSLKQHQRIHTGEKPYSCTHCGKCFVHSGQLNVHMRIHTGEKPFLCTECGESFRQSGDLKRHERKHTGVRPCQCNECGKRFSRPQSLKAHQQIHKGEKLYSCTQCAKGFTRSWHLRRHNQKMHS